MEIKMKTVSNLAAALALLIVLASFILNAAGLVRIDMNDAHTAGTAGAQRLYRAAGVSR
jgi:uncharacterized membrane protein